MRKVNGLNSLQLNWRPRGRRKEFWFQRMRGWRQQNISNRNRESNTLNLIAMIRVLGNYMPKWMSTRDYVRRRDDLNSIYNILIIVRCKINSIRWLLQLGRRKKIMIRSMRTRYMTYRCNWRMKIGRWVS